MSRYLGVSLALYTVSHHLAALVKVLMEHLRMQDLGDQGTGGIGGKCSISTDAVSVTVGARSSDSNYGYVGS